MKLKKHFQNTFVSVLLLCCMSSCATLLNSKETKVDIYAPKGTTINYKAQTLNVEAKNKKRRIFPKRAKEDLQFTLTNDSISTNISIRRRLSTTFFLNFPYTYGIGALIDLTNDKRFTYKRIHQFKIDTLNNTFVVDYKRFNPVKKHDFFMYTSPLKAIDFFSEPMLTFGVEYFLTNNLSISGEYGTIYSDINDVKTGDKVIKDKGNALRFELKFYNPKGILKNPLFNEYFGIESRFITYKFNKDISYTTLESDEHINEVIGVEKNINIVNVKYGFILPIGKKFFLDVYTGLGLRLKRVTFILWGLSKKFL